MKLTKKDYLDEVHRGAPVYQSPLSRKKQRVSAKGRNGKCRVFTDEQIYLYMVSKVKKIESF